MSELYCPACYRSVPLSDPQLHVEFGPVAARLSPNGNFDWGYVDDTFFDYTHLACGTGVRLVGAAEWDATLFKYCPRADVSIEIRPKGGDKVIEKTASEDFEHWGPTYATLRQMLVEALQAMENAEWTE